MDVATASRLLSMALTHSDLINESVCSAQEAWPERQFEEYRKHAAYIMGHIFTNIIAPICEEHPDIAPRWYHEPASDDGDDEGESGE